MIEFHRRGCASGSDGTQLRDITKHFRKRYQCFDDLRAGTVLRSPHVNKKAREQFQLCAYKRLLDIYSSNSKTVDALMKLELPSGVEVEIKV